MFFYENDVKQKRVSVEKVTLGVCFTVVLKFHYKKAAFIKLDKPLLVNVFSGILPRATKKGVLHLK